MSNLIFRRNTFFCEIDVSALSSKNVALRPNVLQWFSSKQSDSPRNKDASLFLLLEKIVFQLFFLRKAMFRMFVFEKSVSTIVVCVFRRWLRLLSIRFKDCVVFTCTSSGALGGLK